jgi:hypothetical protein
MCCIRRVTARGVNPVGDMPYPFEASYLYGSIQPLSGESFFFERPNLDGDCFQVSLAELAKAFPHEFPLIMRDKATPHRAKRVPVPENLRMILQPAARPELNPMERFWEDVKEQIPYELFDTLPVMKDDVASILKSYTRKTMKSLTGYSYLLETLEHLMQRSYQSYFLVTRQCRVSIQKWYNLRGVERERE